MRWIIGGKVTEREEDGVEFSKGRMSKRPCYGRGKTKFRGNQIAKKMLRFL